MPPERWRSFVAVPLGAVLRRDLATAVERWRQRADLAGLRWADPESWHVTLAFLGSVDADAVPRLAAEIEEIAAHHGPMQLRTGGLGGFPSASRARVAWYGVADPSGGLARLAAGVRQAVGVDSAPFRGHVTLGRARGGPVDLRAWRTEGGAPDGALDVERIDLMRSHLGRGPARYELLASSVLGVAAGV